MKAALDPAALALLSADEVASLLADFVDNALLKKTDAFDDGWSVTARLPRSTGPAGTSGMALEVVFTTCAGAAVLQSEVALDVTRALFEPLAMQPPCNLLATAAIQEIAPLVLLAELDRARPDELKTSFDISIGNNISFSDPMSSIFQFPLLCQWKQNMQSDHDSSLVLILQRVLGCTS